MRIPLPLTPLRYLALLFWATTAFADAVCTLGPTGCPGFFAGTIGPLPAVEGVQQILPGGIFVTAGDVLLKEINDSPAPLPCTPADPSLCSDVLRFIDIGNGTAQFYILLSDNPGTEPPDTGIPFPIQAVNFTMDEVGGPFYTAGGATYFIMSDTAPGPDVPEPGTLGTVVSAAGIGILLLFRSTRITRRKGDRIHGRPCRTPGKSGH
jgi:hypothetical protein